MKLAGDRLKGFGLIRYEEEFRKGMAAHGKELIADIPNYTDVQPTIQISDIVV